MIRRANALPPERWGRELLARVQARADRTRLGRYAFEFLMFGLKQGVGLHLWRSHAGASDGNGALVSG